MEEQSKEKQYDNGSLTEEEVNRFTLSICEDEWDDNYNCEYYYEDVDSALSDIKMLQYEKKMTREEAINITIIAQNRRRNRLLSMIAQKLPAGLDLILAEIAKKQESYIKDAGTKTT
jgi:hypothetical protein